MRVKVISNGHPLTTRIIDADTDQDIPYVQSVKWELRAGEKEAVVTLEFAGVPVEIEGTVDSEEVRQQQRIALSAGLAAQYGGAEGGHHKQWLIDQMLRRLLGDYYDEWVRSYNKDAGEGEEQWDVGISP